MSELRVRPFLMFQGQQAEQALQYYVAVFRDAEIVELERYIAGQPGVPGTVRRATFRIGTQLIACTDSPIKHAFDFTPASSFFIDFSSEAELERVSSALAEQGQVLMPLGSYGFSRRFTWLNDRFGVSWQLNLP
jgi:predicted 3-demethylubiquinone-9 3-methyltransferase (glyoxalase superfamily)